MFIKEKFGFTLILSSGHRLEVDFGPNSESENKNRSMKEFEHFPQGMNAELRLFNKNGEKVTVGANKTVDDLLDLCKSVTVLYKGDE